MSLTGTRTRFLKIRVFLLTDLVFLLLNRSRVRKMQLVLLMFLSFLFNFLSELMSLSICFVERNSDKYEDTV